MNSIQYISDKTQISEKQITATLKLLSQDCTIPFIARYRKDITGNLDEISIEQIQKYYENFNEIIKRKESILKSINEQGSLNPELEQKILASFDLPHLEDLYLPYKKKRKTKADIAKEKGLEPLAKIIMAQKSCNIEQSAISFLNNDIPNIEEALQGARDIIAEWINEHISTRNWLRKYFRKQALIHSKVVDTKSKTEDALKFKQYFNSKEYLYQIPSHRLLAILRAEQEGIVKVAITVDRKEAIEHIQKYFIKPKTSTDVAQQISQAVKEAYKRLLEPSISNEFLQECKLKADEKAISIFSDNLKQLLLSPPLGEKRILAIDPGYKTGCKVVCLDEKGDLLYNETLYPHPPQNEIGITIKKILSMVKTYHIEAIAIGNGTASRETERFIKQIGLENSVQVYVVSEAGASVYSTSKIAREEFPNHDVTVRGAVSIGRRLADPLAELVKIEPKSIGVGQYQHDVSQNMLKRELDQVVIRCVNTVGVNLNTASKSLLSYVSGIGEKMAENIINFRSKNGPFKNRKELKNVPRLGEKVFQQAAAFIRVKDSENPLDDSAVHPESYPTIAQMAKDLDVKIEDLIGNREKISQINPNSYVTEQVGFLGIKDILKELEKPGRDPRCSAQIFEFDSKIKSIQDLKIGMIVPGIVNNITAFGCFVNIGIKESGLVHISELNNSYIANIHDVVKLNEQVQVKIIGIDQQRKRISLSMMK